MDKGWPLRSNVEMRRRVACYVLVSIAGAAYSVRRRRSPRLFGVRLPGTPTIHALTIGTPLSAPPMMLAALIIGTAHHRVDIVRVLSFIFLIGVAGEPDTYLALRRPGREPFASAIIAAEVALPLAMHASRRRAAAKGVEPCLLAQADGTH